MENAAKVTENVAEENRIWSINLPDLLLTIVSVVILVLLGMLLIRMGRRVIDRIYKRAEKGRELTPNMRTAHTLIVSLFNALMYFAIIMAVLTTLGINVGSLLTVAGIGGFAVTFSCQSLIKDFVSGIFLWMEGRLSVGDVVTVAGQTGRVESMALRTTTLRGINGKLYTIPNGDIRTVVNMNRDFRTAMVDVTVAHGQDYAAALKALQQAMDALGEKLELENAPVVEGIISMDGRAATVRITCRCETERCWPLEREMRLAALEKMREIEIKV